jgi:transcription elongation factor Elf1
MLLERSVLVNSTVQQCGMVDSTTVVPARSKVDVYSLVMDATVLHETVVRFVAFSSEYETPYLEALRALGYV